jgi:hypothetical protein
MHKEIADGRSKMGCDKIFLLWSGGQCKLFDRHFRLLVFSPGTVSGVLADTTDYTGGLISTSEWWIVRHLSFQNPLKKTS